MCLPFAGIILLYLIFAKKSTVNTAAADPLRQSKTANIQDRKTGQKGRCCRRQRIAHPFGIPCVQLPADRRHGAEKQRETHIAVKRASPESVRESTVPSSLCPISYLFAWIFLFVVSKCLC